MSLTNGMISLIQLNSIYNFLYSCVTVMIITYNTSIIIFTNSQLQAQPYNENKKFTIIHFLKIKLHKTTIFILYNCLHSHTFLTHK